MTSYTLAPELAHLMRHPKDMLRDWHEQLAAYENVKLLDFDNCSSNFNNHEYLIDADGVQMVCHFDIEDCESCFEIGEPVVVEFDNEYGLVEA